MAMNCTRFRANLDAYIDSELDRQTRRDMEEHAAQCAECGALLDQSVMLATTLAELNEGLTVPAETRQAWRQAVRAEANRRTGRRSGRHHMSVARIAAGLAAALVMVFAVGASVTSPTGGTSGFMRNATYETTDVYDDDFVYESAAGFTGSFSVTASNGSAQKVTLMSDGSVADDVSVTTTAGQPAGVIVLRSASRTIATADYADDCLYLDDLTAEYGAYFESRRESGSAEDHSRVLNASIRVPSESLDGFLTALDLRGEVTLKEEYAQDITSDYNDVTARLNVLRSQLEQLNAMNAQAENVSDLIEINQRASEVIADIEAYESVIRDWNSRQSYSTVTLTLREKGADEPTETPTLSQRMGEAFADSVQWLKDFGQSLAVFAASIVPKLVIWVPALIVVIILLKIAFGRKRRK